MKYQNDRISAIWSSAQTRYMMRSVWRQVGQWLYTSGFAEAMRIDASVVDTPYQESGHEVVDELRAYVSETGYVNAHAGMTSSDVIDNVRLGQCAKSAKEIDGLREDLIMRLRNMGSRKPCLGYTHWQPAAQTTWHNRFNAHAESLGGPGPSVGAKLIGGATNTGSAFQILCGGVDPGKFPGFEFGNTWLPRVYEYGWQSSYHVDELRQAQWLEHLMAVVHKLAQDIRFLCHTGEMVMQRGGEYRGSSAMPGKNNPIEAEQICSLARRQPNFARQIWDALAFNGMERTLDTSALLRVTLPEMYQNAAYCLEKMLELLTKVEVNQTVANMELETFHKSATIEDKLAAEIAAGKSRAEVYEKLSVKN